eukprot:COSAG02_NODE_11990_length_1618_cov_7.698486_2_plen_187_part_00
MNPQFPAAAGDQHRRHDDDAARERAGLLWGGAAAGHQGSRQRQRWCRCGAGEPQGLVASVGGAVWVAWRGGGIGDLRLAVEGVLLVAVQVVRLAQKVRQIIPDLTVCYRSVARPDSGPRTIWRTCVARKPGRPGRLLPFCIANGLGEERMFSAASRAPARRVDHPGGVSTSGTNARANTCPPAARD